jgi:glycosyltransferase involved in cell wall biosynthesis
MQIATEHHNLKGYDIILSSTSAFSKGVITDPESIHISYCHTPVRYLWSETHEYIASLRYNKFVKMILPTIIHKLRIWDKVSVNRVDKFIANSNIVQKRIKKYYNRSSTVIYPPVNLENFFISEKIGDYFISGGRMVSYKRFDLLVQTFNRLGWSLKLFGLGPELEKLKKKAKSNIEFLGIITEEEKAGLLSKAKAFLHPQVEDFGITAIESMASGRPVVAFSEGGALETVLKGKTGIFFKEQKWESLFHVLLNFNSLEWDSQEIRNYAQIFSMNRFKEQMESLIKEEYSKIKKS